jgi:hypothetical protein
MFLQKNCVPFDHRLDQENTLSIDFKAGYIEDFLSDRILPSRSLPTARSVIYQHSSQAGIQSSEKKKGLHPMTAARHDFDR